MSSGHLLLALLVLGLGLSALGFVAMRDEPPAKWMLKIRRPGRVVLGGLLVLLAAIIVNYVRYDIAEAVEDNVAGRRVECEKIGSLEVKGEERDAYKCVLQGDEGFHVGCFVRDGDGVLDVSERAEARGAFPGKKVDC